MKTFSEKTVSLESLDEISCNCCGEQINKNEFGYFEEHLSVTKKWGYGPPADGETHDFDLCYDCYKEITGRFEIPPHVTDGE